MDCLPYVQVAALHAASPQLRSFTPGVGALCRSDDWLAGGLVLRNSMARPAGYAFAGYQPLHVYGIRAGVIAGVKVKTLFRRVNADWSWDENSYTGSRLVPFAAFAASWPVTPYLNLEVTGAPAVSKVTPAVLTFGASIDWK